MTDDLFGVSFNDKVYANDNICVKLYGLYDKPKKCRDCNKLVREHYHNKTYLKCDLRKHTRGAGSDHRAGWDACSKFESSGVPHETTR